MADPQVWIDLGTSDSMMTAGSDGAASFVSLERLVQHLTHLEQECQQIRSLLQTVQRRLDQQERAIGQPRQAVAAWIAAQEGGLPDEPVGAGGPDVLSIRVLGGFGVWFQNTPLSLGRSRNGCAILRYLVMHPQRRAAKDVLLEVFWPQDSPQKASHKLHNAVSAVRQAFNAMRAQLAATHLADTDLIVFADDWYSLAPEWPLELDADRFMAHVQAAAQAEEAGHMAEALSQYEAARLLYRGDLLPEDVYVDWTLAPRARLEEMFLNLLGRLAVHYADRQRFAESVGCCREILARDSFREDAWRQLMRCYSRVRQRNQALQAFHDCREVLRRELGVAPMHETSALYEQIMRQEPV